MGRRAVAVVVGVLLAATAILVAPRGHDAPAAPSQTQTQTQTRRVEPALEPPAVPGRLIGSRTSDDGTGPVLLAGPPRRLALAAVCDGSGTVTIAVGPSFTTTIVCDGTVPALSITTSDGPAAGRVSITVTGRPRWAFSLGVEAGR